MEEWKKVYNYIVKKKEVTRKEIIEELGMSDTKSYHIVRWLLNVDLIGTKIDDKDLRKIKYIPKKKDNF